MEFFLFLICNKHHITEEVFEGYIGCFSNLLKTVGISAYYIPIIEHKKIEKELKKVQNDLKIVQDQCKILHEKKLNSIEYLKPIDTVQIKKEKIEEEDISSFYSAGSNDKMTTTSSTSTSSSSLHSEHSLKSKITFSKYDFTYESDLCFLQQDFTYIFDNDRIQPTTKAICLSPVSNQKNLRIDIYHKENNIVLCRSQHLLSNDGQRVIRQALGIPLFEVSKKTVINESFGCERCTKLCNGDLRVKPYGLVNATQSFRFFCSFECLLLFFGNQSSTKTWKSFYEHVKKIEGKNSANVNKLFKSLTEKGDEEEMLVDEEVVEETAEDEEEEEEEEEDKEKTKKSPKKELRRVQKKHQKIKVNIVDDILLKSEKIVKKFIGISKSNFLKLFDKIKHLNKKDRCRYSLKGKLFIILFYLKHYTKDVITSYIYKISGPTIINYFLTVIDALFPLANESFKYYTTNKEEYKQYYIYRFGKNHAVYSVCDGSEQEIVTAMNSEMKLVYCSGKKGYPTVTKLVFCCPMTGKIMHMGASRPGSKSDQGLIHEETEYFDNFNGVNEYIMGDKGFQGAEKVYNKFIIPEFDKLDSSKPLFGKELDLKESMKRFKSIRIIIENVFAQIKKWNITTHRFRIKINNACTVHHKLY
ncbi:hypothetical protein ACTFIW_010501 [Dictyostelium discoideum]